MTIGVTAISDAEVAKLLSLTEGHFCDLKAIDIVPSKLTRTIAALANAEGGELIIGIDEDKARGLRSWRGFDNPEAANSHLAVFESMFPLSTYYAYEFLTNERKPGLVLKVQVAKTRDITKASDGKVYVRRSAQNLPIDSQERLDVLRRDKGLTTFEGETVACDTGIITNSEVIIRFMLEVVPASEPEPWLKKQMLLSDSKPTVAGVVLFADEPQAALPKRCGIKLYRYKSTAVEGTRETLAGDPISVEGCAYDQIRKAVSMTQEMVQSVRVMSPKGLEEVAYPRAAIHEVITNAVLHRDYAITDDIHIKVFDNRVEVMSPGTLPGHVTPANILAERFARNPTIVRLINKFPDAPNKDVGEGLNTAFEAMRAMKLRDPVIRQTGGYVVVALRHEKLASPEQIILEYLRHHDEIRNRVARDICYIGSENKMKTILQNMVRAGLVELVPGRTRYTAAYRLLGEPGGQTCIRYPTRRLHGEESRE